MKYLIIILILLSINTSFGSVYCGHHSSGSSLNSSLKNTDISTTDLKTLNLCLKFNIDDWNVTAGKGSGITWIAQSLSTSHYMWVDKTTGELIIQNSLYFGGTWYNYKDETSSIFLSLDTDYTLIWTIEYDDISDEITNKLYVLSDDEKWETHSKTTSINSAITYIFKDDTQQGIYLNVNSATVNCEGCDIYFDWQFVRWGTEELDMLKSICIADGGTSFVNESEDTINSFYRCLRTFWYGDENYVATSEGGILSKVPNFLSNAKTTNTAYIYGNPVTYKRRYIKTHKTKIR